jgi:hypothetical protein
MAVLLAARYRMYVRDQGRFPFAGIIRIRFDGYDLRPTDAHGIERPPR